MGKWKKDRQCNGQRKRDKRTRNNVQNTTQKKRVHLRPGVNSGAPEG